MHFYQLVLDSVYCKSGGSWRTAGVPERKKYVS